MFSALISVNILIVQVLTSAINSNYKLFNLCYFFYFQLRWQEVGHSVAIRSFNTHSLYILLLKDIKILNVPSFGYHQVYFITSFKFIFSTAFLIVVVFFYFFYYVFDAVESIIPHLNQKYLFHSCFLQ